MAKVRIRMTRGSGREILRPKHVAARLVRLGFYEYVKTAPVPAPAPQPVPEPEPVPEPTSDDLESLTVAELREQVGDLEVEGTGSSGNVLKADLIRALHGGTYQRRDMQAEE